MAKARLYEVWADVILSCNYEVEASSKEEAVRKVSAGDLVEKRRVRATDPIVTSVELSGEENT